MSDDNDDYKVGYGRPPVRSQFKPGQSGNRAGRAKGSRNIATLMERELARLVPVTVDGRRRKISKGEVMVRQVADRAAKGDLPAFAAVSRAMDKKLLESSHASTGKASPDSSTEVSPEKYEAMVAAFLENFKGEGSK